MVNFYVGWAIVGAILLGLAILAGHVTEPKSVLGILIDERGRFSLNRLQLVMWTLLIFSTLLGLAFSTADLKLGQIPPEYLPLVGISAATGVLAGAVKASKDVRGAVVQRQGKFAVDAAGTRLPLQQALAKARDEDVGPHFAQVFLEEEGQGADRVVNVTKFQNFILTLALGIWFLVGVIRQAKFPELDPNVIWLLGISHATYVGGKVPDKP